MTWTCPNCQSVYEWAHIECYRCRRPNGGSRVFRPLNPDPATPIEAERIEAEQAVETDKAEAREEQTAEDVKLLAKSQEAKPKE